MKSPNQKREIHSEDEYGKGDNTILNFYQDWLSPVKGGNSCPMHPSCSQYSKITFTHNSSFKAFALSCERLLRCGHELDLYRPVVVDDMVKYYDPVPEEPLHEK
jgi:hypothetical protein